MCFYFKYNIIYFFISMSAFFILFYSVFSSIVMIFTYKLNGWWYVIILFPQWMIPVVINIHFKMTKEYNFKILKFHICQGIVAWHLQTPALISYGTALGLLTQTDG